MNEKMKQFTFETVTCTVHNPLKHPRSIYDGLKNAERIWLEPGETKEGVVLAKHMADMLLLRTNDLVLTDVKAAAKVKAPRPAVDDAIMDDDDIPALPSKKGRAA